jgi:Flp pilus assembly protein TadG
MHPTVMSTRNRHHQHHHSGQVIIMVALGMFVLLGFVALSVDVGYALNQRRDLQTAADASALAVAETVMAGTTDQSVFDDTASSYTAGNGFPDADISVSVGGPSNAKTVTVDLTSDVQKFFIGVIYHGDWKVSAHAVATVYPKPANYALLVLDQTGYPAQFVGNSSVNVLGGGAMSNAGMQCKGNSRIHADETMDAHSGFSTTGNCGFSGGKGSNPSAAIVPDPLANVPPPPKPSKPSIGSTVVCNNNGTKSKPDWACPAGALYSGVSVSGNDGSITFSTGNHQVINTTISGDGNNPTVTFNPGTYYFKNSTLSIGGNNSSMVFKSGTYIFYFEDSTLSISGNSSGFSASGSSTEFYFDKDSSVSVGGNTNTTLPSGIYYFDGASTKLTGNKNVSGSNILFFFDKDATFDTGGNTQYNFTSAATSLYTGGQNHMLFYAARGSGGTFSMQGNSSSTMDGIVYLPSATLSLGGNPSGIWANGQLIVDKIGNNGNPNIKIQYKDYVDIGAPKIYLTQ